VKRIVSGAYRLVAELRGGFADDLGDILREGKIRAAAFTESARPEIVVPGPAGVENIREGHRAGVRDAQLFRPVAIRGRRAVGLVAGVAAESGFVDGRRVERMRVG